MAILNYTTKVNAERTAAEIQKLLVRHKAMAVLNEYENGIITHISFRVQTHHGVVSVRLPAHVDGVYKLLQRESIRKEYKTKERATWVAWRILKDWIEAQMALVEVEMASLEQIFLPYIQTNTGETVYDKFLTGGFKALTDQGKPHE